MSTNIAKVLKDLNDAHRDAIIQLILTVGNDIIKKNPEIKTIGFGASYEYNDEDYYYNYRVSADDIEINGYNMWQLEDEDEAFCKKELNIESIDRFNELLELIEATFEPFDGNLHQVFGQNFKLVISKNDVKIENDAYEY